VIELSLSPSTFPARQATELTLKVHNVGEGTCKQVNLRLGRSHGLLIIRGSPQFSVELLKPDQRATLSFTVRAEHPGRFEITTANYSYRDDRGRSQHPTGPSWVLQVSPAVATPPPERPGPPMVARTKVFISYRWSDSKDRAHLLYSELVRAFGREHVHLDQEGAQLGGDFQTRLDKGLEASSAMLVLIGPDWNPELQGTGWRRLDDENDPIRHEVNTALLAGIHLIPVMSREVAVPDSADLPECLRPLLRREIAWIYPTSVTANIKRIVDELRPYVAGGRFQ